MNLTSLMQTGELVATKLAEGDGTDTCLKRPLPEVAHRSMSPLAAAKASIVVFSLGFALGDDRLIHGNPIDHFGCRGCGAA